MAVKEKFTFKKQPQETGLAGVGHPYPDVDIKHNKKVVGYISAPNWRTKGNLWQIRLMTMVEDNQWKWVALTTVFENELDARNFLNTNATSILAMGLRYEDD